MITQVTIFETDDGKQFPNLQEAKKHSAMLDVKAAFKEYQSGRPGGMSLSGFFDFLHSNREIISIYLEKPEEVE